MEAGDQCWTVREPNAKKQSIRHLENCGGLYPTMVKTNSGCQSTELPERFSRVKLRLEHIQTANFTFYHKERMVWPFILFYMLGNFFNYLFLSKFSKKSLFPTIFLLIYNLNIKQFGSQMKPHILWDFIWIQIICKGLQRSSKLTASGLRVNSCRCILKGNF